MRKDVGGGERVRVGTGRNMKERQEKLLDMYFKDWKVFIDTCSLLKEAAPTFWERARPYILKYNNPVIVPERVLHELQKIYRNAAGVYDPVDVRNAERCLSEFLPRYQQEHLLEFRGEPVDREGHADNVFITQFTRHRMTYNLLLITQDADLGADIRNLVNQRSVQRGKKIHVRRIDGGGNLFPQDGKKPHTKRTDSARAQTDGDRRPHGGHEHTAGQRPAPQRTDSRSSAMTTVRKTVVTAIADDPLPAAHIPIEGEMVFRVQNGVPERVRLGKEIGKGGEGRIYETGTPYVAKIYARDCLTVRRREKIRRMLSCSISCAGICWPIAELSDKSGNFVGYLMPRAQGQSLQIAVFSPRRLQRFFPHWKKVDLVILCITILEKIKYLHDHDILIGDLNDQNILVVSATEVYFVDTDSYQIEGFPCPVGTPVYTAPEVQGQPFSSFLRTKGNEAFAIATLLFRIMLPGKTPYSQQGGNDLQENIARGDFSYPCGENSNRRAPDGPWRFIWSHLPRRAMKEPFYQTFRKGEAHYEECDRLDVNAWLANLREYKNLLTNGKYAEQDALSLEIFPNRYKHIEPNADAKSPQQTKTWGHSTPHTKSGAKQSKSPEKRPCRVCKSEVPVTQLDHGVCSLCRGEIYEWKQCRTCGSRFCITAAEHAFFVDKGLAQPENCRECREARKKERETWLTTPQQNTSSRTPVPQSDRAEESSSFETVAGIGIGLAIAYAVVHFLL